MKPCLLLVAIGLLFACSSAPIDAPAEDAPPETGLEDAEDAIVARVNGQPIYRGSYRHSLTVMRDRLARRQNSVEDYVNARSDALDGLVSNELLYQEAERMGVTVSESEVYGELERIGSNRGGVDTFISFMNSFGLTREQAIESVRKRLAVDRYIDETITRDIRPDEGELRRYYEENPERFREPLNVRVSQILILCGPRTPEKTAEEKRRRAEGILDRIRGGESFSTMAREHSEDSSAALNGDIGFVSKGASYPEVEAAAFELEVGEVSDVIRTDAGFHIITVTERRGGALPDFEAVEDACRRAVVNTRRNAQVRATIERLLRTADVESYLN